MHSKTNPAFTTSSPIEPSAYALQQLYIHCEFLLFSIFLMTLAAFDCGLPATKFAKLKESIMLLIVHPTADTFFAHLQGHPTVEFEGLLYEALRKADSYYVDSANHSMTLTKNVLTIAGYDVNREKIHPEVTTLMNWVEREVMWSFRSGSLELENLRKMVKRASAAIDIYEKDGSSLPQMFRDERREKRRERETQRV